MSKMYNLRDRAGRLIDQANAIDDALDVLKKLMYHHESQAKPQSEPVRRQYNAELAKQSKDVINSLKKAWDIQ